ncbi:MAG: alpha/beta fold hydrolase [Tepidiformaceae bacterium]
MTQPGGLPIAVYDEGQGDPPFVFIHGLACDHTFWQPQADDLKRDHRCLSVDLRGRGESPAVPPYDTSQQAEDIAHAMVAASLGPAIIVGHSLGGPTALLLNDRYPELVLGIVAGDSPYRAHQPGGFGRLAASIREQGTRDALRGLVDGFFVEGTPEAVADHARQTMLACPPDVAAGMLENSEPFIDRMADLLRKADLKPFMAIWAERPAGDPPWLREVTTFLRQEPIAGAGHFFQLEQPAITNALLRAFLDDVARDPRLQPPS